MDVDLGSTALTDSAAGAILERRLPPDVGPFTGGAALSGACQTQGCPSVLEQSSLRTRNHSRLEERQRQPV